MRFLHVADLHIGKIVNGFSMIEDQRHILSQIIELAKDSSAQAIVVAGDFYDKSAPSAEAVSVVDKFLTDAVANGLKVVAISGNHDSSERIAYASELLKTQGVAVSPVYAGNISSYPVEDEHGVVRFWLMPFIKPAHVRPYFPNDEIGGDYTKAIECALRGCRLNPTERHVLVCHQFVISGASHPETSDSEITLGGLDSVDASVFEPFCYVALGHIHRAQRIGKDTVRYSGSPLKYSYSEIKHIKSATLVEIGQDGHADIELLPLTPLRDFREIKGPIEALVSDEVSSNGNSNDYMKIVLTDDHPPIDALSRIRKVYPNVMGIEYENTRTMAQSWNDRAESDITKIDPLELFSYFYEMQNGSQLTDQQSRLANLAYTQASENEGAAQQ